MDDDTIAVFTVTSLLPQLSQKMKLPTSRCFEIKHDSVPDSPKGITFGSYAYCGVVLPEYDLISHLHFSLTFDTEDRLVIMDHSTHGIEVKYGEQGAGLRDQRQCILNDPKLPPQFRHIEIGVAGVMTFKVDVRLMMSSKPSYRQVAARFRYLCDKKSKDLAQFFQRSTLQQTRGNRDLDDISDIWLPLGDYEQERWSRQVKFMEILKDHHHVVDILNHPNTSEASLRQIEMEYLSGGSLDKPEDPHLVSEVLSEFSEERSEFSEECSEFSEECSEFSEERSEFSNEEATSILAQCLSVLVEMHAQSPPICHRDIKPSNILIKQRTSSGICVKIASFGEANTEGEKDMGGGDTVYGPPEFWDEKCEPSLDIWSLGLTTLKLLDEGLHEAYLTRPTEFSARMDQSTDSLVQFLLEHMIHEPPYLRSTAKECLESLLKLQADGKINIEPCGCLEPKSCADDVSECEDEGVRTPTMSNVQEESSNSSTPTQTKLADGQSHETNSSSAEGSTEGSTTPTQTPASPAHISTGGEASESTDETRALLKGKRRAEVRDELSDQKRPKI
ncbi:unnamed protein product [Clonostachys solani]|uniref:non-specific serine/threonine protein kinase n=1 Tax=Clonostachys solani TaxID=160281 RepID=A0A9N9W9H3_9HYPO|nr:unnamed protein product [Clonostachys solani]